MQKLKQSTCSRQMQDMNTSKNLEYKEKMTPHKTLDLQNLLEGARELISSLTVLKNQMTNLSIEVIP